MKTKKSKKLLALKKSNIAQLNDQQKGVALGGSPGSTYTSSFTVTLFSDCTTILCPLNEHPGG